MTPTPTVVNESALLAFLSSGEPYEIERFVSADEITTHFYRVGEEDPCGSITLSGKSMGRAETLITISLIRQIQGQRGDASTQGELMKIGRELQAITGG